MRTCLGWALVIVLVGTGAVRAQTDETSQTSPETEPRAYLGVHVEAAEDGVRLRDVVADSPAAKAGLRAGDVVTAVNDEELRSTDALADAIHAAAPGDQVRMNVRRGEGRLVLRVRLDEAPAPAAQPRGAVAPRRRAKLGAMLATMDDHAKRLAGTAKGVLIVDVEDNSAAARAGLQAGDVITAIGNCEVAEPRQLQTEIGHHAPGDEVHVAYCRNGEGLETVVCLGGWAPPAVAAAGASEATVDIVAGPDSTNAELREQVKALYAEIPRCMERLQEAEKLRSETLGRDLGQMMQRLDRIEERLKAIEERLGPEATPPAPAP